MLMLPQCHPCMCKCWPRKWHHECPMRRKEHPALQILQIAPPSYAQAIPVAAVPPMQVHWLLVQPTPSLLSQIVITQLSQHKELACSPSQMVQTAPRYAIANSKVISFILSATKCNHVVDCLKKSWPAEVGAKNFP